MEPYLHSLIIHGLVFNKTLVQLYFSLNYSHVSLFVGPMFLHLSTLFTNSSNAVP